MTPCKQKHSLPYRAPYNWEMVNAFFAARKIDGLEWVGENFYGRTIQMDGTKGKFTATHNTEQKCIDIDIELSNATNFQSILKNITRILDLNSDSTEIDITLKKALGADFSFKYGTKLPGIWNTYEAGIRAILGQQISVTAAHTYCSTLIRELGEDYNEHKLFPTPQAVAKSELDFFRMPQAKKDTLRRLSEYVVQNSDNSDPVEWIDLKGIGPWTVQYVQMRGQSNPDIFMGTDLGVKKMHKTLPSGFSPQNATPWRSYLTLQFWRSL